MSTPCIETPDFQSVFTPMPALPAQFYATVSPARRSGCAALYLGLIEDAFKQIERYLAGGTKLFGVYKPGLRSSAYWFLQTLSWIDGSPAIVPFVTACEVCSIDPDRLRHWFKVRILEELRKGNPAVLRAWDFNPTYAYQIDLSIASLPACDTAQIPLAL